MSLPAGAVAHVAAGAAQQQMSRGIEQAVGKASIGSSSPPGTRPPGHAEINWTNFNYPPLLRLIHYDLNELPTTLTGLARSLKISFQITTFTCCLNLFDNIIIVMSTKAPAKWLIQSLL